MRSNRSFILFIIILAQFCCTSLWFAGNAIMDDLVTNFNLSSNALSHLTSAVQFGFITGTLAFALLNIADRFPPSRVFFVCALLGGISNWCTVLGFNTFISLFLFRFMTGFFLAGIYPVGMKIAADYFEKGLGKSLSFLVGALVLGTALPHLIKGVSTNLPWKVVIQSTTLLAVLGGLLLVLFVPNGPFRKPSQRINLSASLEVFKNPRFRAASIGYFGHMWELYSFWAFVPILLATYQSLHPEISLNIPILSFSIIAIGALACVIGGYLSLRFGTRRIANLALLASGICCLLSPLFFGSNNTTLFLVFLLFWGMVVIADSPLFSTLVAINAPPEFKGTALTIVTCIGFLVTIFSIQLLTSLSQFTNPVYIYMVLALGPIFGLLNLGRRTKLS